MRARHRHFNPAHAGATAAYDARFISGLNDGDEIATWSSRSGTNDATQSTSANRPKYETNEINGNPVANFTPANGHRLVISITNPSSVTIIAVQRRNTTGINTINFGGGPYALWWFTDNIIYVQLATGFLTFSPAQTQTGTFVITVTKDGTTSSQVYLNGSSFRNSITPTASSGTFTRIGDADGYFNNGAIGSLCLIPSFASDALRKRIEQHAARSFKLSCN